MIVHRQMALDVTVWSRLRDYMCVSQFAGVRPAVWGLVLSVAMAQFSLAHEEQPASSSLSQRWEKVLDADPHHILHARLSADGRDVLAISSGGDAWILSAADGAVRLHETGPHGPGIFSYDEREIILFRADDRLMKRINRETARVVAEIRLSESEVPRGVPVQELDDGTIVSVTSDARVEYWTPSDRKRRTVFRYKTSFQHFGSQQANRPTVLVLRAAPKHLFVAVLGVVAVVDVADGNVTAIGEGVRIDPTSREWSLRQKRPDNDRMILSNRIELLDLDLKARTLTKADPIPRNRDPKTGSPNAPFMMPLAVSNDRKWIVGWNGSAKNEPAALQLGNISTGGLTSVPWGFAPIYDVSTDRECRLISAVNQHGAVCVWDWKSPVVEPGVSKQ